MIVRAICLGLTMLALSVTRAHDQSGLPVSLELVLALDTSASVSDAEFRFQTDGIAQALRHPDIIALIGQHEGGVAVTVTQWSAGYLNKQVIDWQLLRSPATVLAFAAALDAVERQHTGNYTAISYAIDHAVKLIEENPFAGRQRKVDISGDGRNNSGPHPSRARDRAAAKGITVNGLAVLDGDNALADYYAVFVTGGPGAFVVAAQDYSDFARAMRVKLERELSVQMANAIDGP